MSCDIHAFIEYKSYPGATKYDVFAYDQLAFGRSYALFGVMAGVRERGFGPPVVEPRGIPDKDSLSWTVESVYTLYVSDKDDDERTATRQDAERWVAQGSSTWWTEPYHAFPRITDPDWHTASWLSTSEFEEVLNRLPENYRYPEAKAVLAAMQELPDARLVFWFDN